MTFSQIKIWDFQTSKSSGNSILRFRFLRWDIFDVQNSRPLIKTAFPCPSSQKFPQDQRSFYRKCKGTGSRGDRGGKARRGDDGYPRVTYRGEWSYITLYMPKIFKIVREFDQKRYICSIFLRKFSKFSKNVIYARRYICSFTPVGTEISKIRNPGF